MLLLRAVRTLHSMPLYLLSKATQISPCRLSLIEREVVTATPEEQQKIAQALAVRATALFQSVTAAALAEHAKKGV